MRICVYSQDIGVGRIAGSQLLKTQDEIFTGSQTGTSNNDWTSWQGVTTY